MWRTGWGGGGATPGGRRPHEEDAAIPDDLLVVESVRWPQLMQMVLHVAIHQEGAA